MNALWIALGFLSRFPSKRAEFKDADTARSVFWFPAVGIVIAAAVVLTAHATMLVTSTSVAALFGLVTWVWVTGALHLDGLADTCDGFSASGRGPGRALEAMKDSRIGAHGSCALILTLLGKWVLLQQCLDVGALVPAVFAAVVIARSGVGWILVWAKPAVPTGLGALFARELQGKGGHWIVWPAALWASALVCAFGLCGLAGWPILLSAWGGSLGVVAMALFVLVRRCRACFGGVTGDTHGASIELTEVLVLAVHATVFGTMNA